LLLLLPVAEAVALALAMLPLSPVPAVAKTAVVVVVEVGGVETLVLAILRKLIHGTPKHHTNKTSHHNA
jgi:hypothetical protein